MKKEKLYRVFLAFDVEAKNRAEAQNYAEALLMKESEVEIQDVVSHE